MSENTESPSAGAKPRCEVSTVKGSHHGWRVQCTLHGVLAFHAFQPRVIVERHARNPKPRAIRNIREA